MCSLAKSNRSTLQTDTHAASKRLQLTCRKLGYRSNNKKEMFKIQALKSEIVILQVYLALNKDRDTCLR